MSEPLISYQQNMQEMRAIYQRLVNLPSPEEEEALRDELLDQAKLLVDSSIDENATEQWKAVQTAIQNWDPLELWFTEVPDLKFRLETLLKEENTDISGSQPSDSLEMDDLPPLMPFGDLPQQQSDQQISSDHPYPDEMNYDDDNDDERWVESSDPVEKIDKEKLERRLQKIANMMTDLMGKSSGNLSQLAVNAKKPEDFSERSIMNDKTDVDDFSEDQNSASQALQTPQVKFTPEILQEITRGPREADIPPEFEDGENPFTAPPKRKRIITPELAATRFEAAFAIDPSELGAEPVNPNDMKEIFGDNEVDFAKISETSASDEKMPVKLSGDSSSKIKRLDLRSEEEIRRDQQPKISEVMEIPSHGIEEEPFIERLTEEEEKEIEEELYRSMLELEAIKHSLLKVRKLLEDNFHSGLIEEEEYRRDLAHNNSNLIMCNSKIDKIRERIPSYFME